MSFNHRQVIQKTAPPPGVPRWSEVKKSDDRSNKKLRNHRTSNHSNRINSNCRAAAYLNRLMSPRLWNVSVAFFALLAGIAYGAIHFTSVSVSELTKDTFEMFSFDARLLPIEIQHRLMFSMLGLVLALSGGYLAKDYFHAKGHSGRIMAAFGDLRLWIVFLGALVISCSVFYHAFIDV